MGNGFAAFRQRARVASAPGSATGVFRLPARRRCGGAEVGGRGAGARHGGRRRLTGAGGGSTATGSAASGSGVGSAGSGVPVARPSRSAGSRKTAATTPATSRSSRPLEGCDAGGEPGAVLPGPRAGDRAARPAPTPRAFFRLGGATGSKVSNPPSAQNRGDSRVARKEAPLRVLPASLPHYGRLPQGDGIGLSDLGEAHSGSRLASPEASTLGDGGGLRLCRFRARTKRARSRPPSSFSTARHPPAPGERCPPRCSWPSMRRPTIRVRCQPERENCVSKSRRVRAGHQESRAAARPTRDLASAGTARARGGNGQPGNRLPRTVPSVELVRAFRPG